MAFHPVPMATINRLPQMAHKPLPIVTAKNLLYLLKVINEAIVLTPPKTLSDARLMLSNFEVITSEAIKEAESALEPSAAAA
jgi:hypothetical protein